tara:strand:+ start:4514 stop:4699 length:186 start_codon:yes stop_codon:yes gene_type:complete
MIKEFEIKDILDAVNSISNIKKKERNIDEKKNFNIKNDALILNNQVKSHKSEVLVLNEMIE